MNGTVVNSKWFSLLADTAMFMTFFQLQSDKMLHHETVIIFVNVMLMF